MTRIDFYIIDGENLNDRLAFVCKLVSKAWYLEHRIFIHCEDNEQVQALSDMLWATPGQRFIPHEIAPCEGKAQILLSDGIPPADHFDLYINLREEQPDHFSRFARLMEVIHQTQETLIAGRARFRAYQQKHYPLYRHDMRSTPVPV